MRKSDEELLARRQKVTEIVGDLTGEDLDRMAELSEIEARRHSENAETAKRIAATRPAATSTSPPPKRAKSKLERKFNVIRDSLIQVVEARGEVFGKDDNYMLCVKLINDFLEAYTQWLRKTA